ncbi:ABC-2 type transport system ATP-binding protein [Rhodothalassium salexigens DSM 2132]|uniref:ABC-2 type transport system ATP-binding protein n=1 Tax=Rhodothalassium salexigens DSM 2132 TaxID=1188247 RepID=A0A4V2SP60_RHOSA|nr:ABC transporter ATP-binding protein [Rhodothalassium salexigens]MBB4212000.1 ABC-2 type transport system ATP-binding protein [Rhodothalassium salexigens DSM 2132]MBK1638514.1 hypothetical protein [Rhodothalassium salexigens DSM 2132]TCP33416.1 ABC-2 type transport system ATP-binding protein [Rhodothalassium salexigens DSM 2132]
MAPRLEARSLVKRFGPITAVDHISLKVEAGEVLGFLGPNGAGKTTTMKMLTGFLDPSEGEAYVGGVSVADDPERAKRQIGYLPEGAPAYGDMTPRGFLTFAAETRGLTGAARDAAVARAVHALSLDRVIDQTIETLSKGFRRRVGLAQAILHDPDVLILDEPTDGLDPNQKHDVRNLIDGMRKDKAIIVSTHILEEVEAVCTRVVLIDRGRIVFDGTPAEFRGRAEGAGTLRVILPADAVEDAVEQFEDLDEVSAMDRHPTPDGRVRFTLTGDDRIALINRVTGVIDGAGWPADELELDAGRLDEVFRALTSRETDHQDSNQGQEVRA